jgi:hypothetical protein
VATKEAGLGGGDRGVRAVSFFLSCGWWVIWTRGESCARAGWVLVRQTYLLSTHEGNC